MDLNKILKNFNVEESKISDLKDAITREIGTEFIPKTQYNKKVQQLDGLQEKVNDLEAMGDKPNEYKEKYEKLQGEYEAYKDNIAKSQSEKSKREVVEGALKKAGCEKEKLLKLLVNQIDLEKLEIENGEIKNAETIINPIKESYADFFTVEEIKGSTTPATPPSNTESLFTKEQIAKMSTDEINANWDKVSKVLES